MIEWVENKVAELTAKGAGATLSGIGKIVLQCDDLILIVGIIGIYFMIFGNRKTGTKLTSLSMLVYLLAEVISKC